MNANRSLYNYALFMSGVFWGIAQFISIKAGRFDISDGRILFFVLLSIGIPTGLIRQRISNLNQVRLYELNRTWTHIVGDFMCAMGTVGLFSMLSYFIISGRDLRVSDWEISREGMAIIANMILFIAGVAILKHHARRERNEENVARETTVPANRRIQ